MKQKRALVPLALGALLLGVSAVRSQEPQPSPSPGCSRNQPKATVTIPKMQAGRSLGSDNHSGPTIRAKITP